MILPTKVESKKIERKIWKIKCRSIKISKDKNIEKNSRNIKMLRLWVFETTSRKK